MLLDIFTIPVPTYRSTFSQINRIIQLFSLQFFLHLKHNTSRIFIQSDVKPPLSQFFVSIPSGHLLTHNHFPSGGIPVPFIIGELLISSDINAVKIRELIPYHEGIFSPLNSFQQCLYEKKVRRKSRGNISSLFFAL